MNSTDDTIELLANKLSKSFVEELQKQAKEKEYSSIYELILFEYNGVVETTFKIDITKSKKEVRELINKTK